MRLILFSIFISIFFIQCKSTKNNTVNKEITPIDSVVTYKAVVSFFSKGSGVDSDKFSKTKQLLITYSEKSDCGISYTLATWGREGEKDFCINAQSKKCYNSLISEIKILTQESDRVRITENASCRK